MADTPINPSSESGKEEPSSDASAERPTAPEQSPPTPPPAGDTGKQVQAELFQTDDQPSEQQPSQAAATSEAPQPTAPPAAPQEAAPSAVPPTSFAPAAVPESPQPAAQPAEKKNPADIVPSFMKKAENQPSVTTEEKLWAFVSYVPLIALLALVLKPGSKYILLHGRQGLLLTLIFFLSVFIYLFPFIGTFLGGILHLGSFILGLFSMYQAFIGNWWKIPVLGDVAEMIPAEAFAKVARNAAMGPDAANKETPSPSGETAPPPPPEAPAQQVPPSEAGEGENKPQ